MVAVSAPFWFSPKRLQLFRFIANAILSLLVKLAVAGLWAGSGIAKKENTLLTSVS